MEFDLENDMARDYDEMWFNHASQLMNMRNLTPARAAAASLQLMRRVFGGDVRFTSWLAKQELRTHPRDE